MKHPLIAMLLLMFASGVHAAGDLDITFDPGGGVTGTVYAIVTQPDNKIIAGGSFGIKRLNVDGSQDATFNNGVGGTVYAIARQDDGKIIMGGSFAGLKRIVRLNTDGSADLGFNTGSGPNTTVRAVVVQPDGKIIIGGDFTVYNGTTRQYVARLHTDGSLDNSFDPGVVAIDNVSVMALQADGKIIIGCFEEPGFGVNNLIRLNVDGSEDISSRIRILDGDVKAIVVHPNGQVIIGGKFTMVETSHDYKGITNLARLNPDESIDDIFNAQLSLGDYPVLAIATHADDKVLIGGRIRSVNGISRHGVARLSSSGVLDSSFDPGSGTDDYIYATAVRPDGKIVIGGNFTTYNGITRNRIAVIHSGDTDADGIEDAADPFLNDTDNDGMPDFWETTYGLNLLVNDASGDVDNDGLTNLQEYNNGSNPTTVVTVKNDYNADGIAGWIWKGISSGNETVSQNWQLTFPLYSNNWGIPDRFYHPVFPDQVNWEIMTSGDFNKDGDADILWRHTSTAQWKVWQMQNGLRAAQTTPSDFDLAHEWQVIGAGDTDKDGDDDVILNNASTGEVLIWEMQNHTVAATHSVGTKAGYALNRVGDFNKDGDVDLLFRQVGGDILAIWEIEANAFVQGRAFVNTGTGYNPVCAGDFDNDGDDDIMLINSTTTQEKWFVMENFVRSQVVGSTNTGFVFKGCGDYDGDGDADVLWQRSADDANRVILQQNYGATKQTVYTNAFGAVSGFVYRGNSN